jgi:hypothetical protein
LSGHPEVVQQTVDVSQRHEAIWPSATTLIIDNPQRRQARNMYIKPALCPLSDQGEDACWISSPTTTRSGFRVAKIIRAAFVLLLAWATYEVTVAGSSLKKGTLKIAGAAIAVSAALQFMAVLSDWLSSKEKPVRRDIEGILFNRLSVLYGNGTLIGNPASISMHVFEVPIWFRRIFSYKFRFRLREVFPLWIQKMAWRPALVRVGEAGMRRLPSSGVIFRKGYGLVGVTLQANETNNVYWVNFNDRELTEALSRGPKAWKNEPKELTQNLRYEAARRLANRYSEALALVVQDDTGEALGCLTIEAMQGSSFDLHSNAALLAELGATADLLGPVLSRRHA